MSGPLTLCWDTFLGQTSSIKGLTYRQLRDNQASWETFRRIQLFNSNASTVQGQGGIAPFYQYRDSVERVQYAQGGNLYAFYLGYTSTIS